MTRQTDPGRTWTRVTHRARREAHQVALRLTGVPTPALTVDRFEQIPGADVTPVQIPGTPAPAWTAHTLQTRRLSALDGDVAETPPPARPCAVALAGASLITGGGAVVTPDGRLVLESLLDREHWTRDFARPRRIRRRRRIDGEQASLISLWSENYYHWLIDCLPRLATLDAAGLAHLPLIVPEPLLDFQARSLAALGVGVDRTTPYLGEDDHLLPERLVWASLPAPVNFPTPFVVDWLRGNLRDTLTGAGDRASAPSRRYLVSRGGVRRLANEDAVLRALEPLGFELLQPHRMDFAAQVAAFAGATAIVGPHGAGLTNMAFADPAPVLELFPPGRVGWHYYTLARAAGHRYWYVVGDYDRSGSNLRYLDFEVDVELVVRTVEAMLDGGGG